MSAHEVFERGTEGLASGRRLKTLQIGLSGMASGIGGAERYYFGLTHALPEAGADVRGFVLGDVQDVDGIRGYAPEGTSLFGRWTALRAAVSKAIRQSDLVASHFALHAFGMLDLLKDTPFVVHFHGPWALESAAEGAGVINVTAKRLLEGFVYRRGARFVVLSRAFGAILEREYRIPASLIRVVPGGVDVHRFRGIGSRSEARLRLGWPSDRPTIVSVRRLVRAKGLENFIAAVDTVRRRVPDVLVVIVGMGPLEKELRARADEAGLGRFVRFEGYVPEALLPLVYRAADLFVVPTIVLEGFGLVVIEALACGTPVLVTPVGGLPEVVSGLEPRLVFEIM